MASAHADGAFPFVNLEPPFAGLGIQDQAAQAWRKMRGQRELRRLLDRVTGRLSEVLPEFTRLVGCKSWGVEVEFRFAALPWKRTLSPRESHLEIRVFVSPDMLELTETQLLSLLVRTVLLAASESGLFETVADGVVWERFPLLRLGAIPSEGVGDSWSSSADLAAYAKVARLIGDLAEPWLREARLQTSWPMLELIPRREVRQIRPVRESRGYEVPLLKGFAQLAAGDRARLVAGDFQDALRLRMACDDPDRGVVALGFTSWVAGTRFELRLRTAKLRPAGSASWLRVEYEADVEGGRCRAVVGGAVPDVRSGWLPVGAGAAALLHMEPNVDFGWLADGQVWLAPRGARPKRLVFDPKAAAETPDDDGGDEGELPAAHPAFAAHFVDPLYDDAGADFGPFGSDEGYEFVREWGTRRAELGPGSTVAGLLGEQEAGFLDRWQQTVDPSACPDAAALVDEAVWVQAAGFTLLRLAGYIDAEGKVATLHALEFLIAFYDAPSEYVTQRDDLARWQRE